MSTISARCRRCGTTSRMNAAVVLVAASLDRTDDCAANVSWICPGCSTFVHLPLNASGFAAVVVAGGGLLSAVPHLGPHPELPAGGPPLTADDVLDLHLALQRQDWFTRLAGTTRHA